MQEEATNFSDELTMLIKPYISFGPLRFGVTTKDECIASFGAPVRIRRNREGIEEYHYSDFIVRFDPQKNVVQECTLFPKRPATVDDIELTWDEEFLRRACERDGDAKNVFGLIVLNHLGIAVSGIHDRDESQLAVTAYRKGLFDDLLPQGKPLSGVP
jgi:hypothetical protein